MYRQFFPLKRTTISEAGFTLIELMIAISIFSIGILAVASMQLSAISGNKTARMISDEMVEAEEKIEELMALAVIDPDHPDLKDTGDLHTDANVEGGYDRVWNVTMVDHDGDGTNDSKRIEVTVSHQNDSERTATIECYLPNL
jgi:type IV pilus assembly protein PilV